jgi:hypothetical protein
MTTTTIPQGSRTSVLSDLKQRREKAMDLLYAAEEAGDERRWRKATARFWLRENMIWYLEQRPDGAICPTCVWGATDWPAQWMLDTPDVWSCLEHWTPALEREAQQMAAAARWFGRR